MEKEKPEITAANMRKIVDMKQSTINYQDLRAILAKIEEASNSGEIGCQIDFTFSLKVITELESRGFKVQGSYISW